MVQIFSLAREFEYLVCWGGFEIRLNSILHALLFEVLYFYIILILAFLNIY